MTKDRTKSKGYGPGHIVDYFGCGRWRETGNKGKHTRPTKRKPKNK